MAQEGFKRKLTAILSADIAGNSRLMGEDEEAIVRTLTTYREVFKMIDKGTISKSLRVFFIIFFLSLLPHALLAEDNKQPLDCIDRADRRIIEIRSFPDVQYLHTLDDQNVLLNEFYDRSLIFFPQCVLYKKFYYWQSEIREVVSTTKNGNIRHTIRCYNNVRSTFCPEMSDPLKTHGDVAEFYDRNGNFMGLSVYVGDGKYCALPYDGYRK